MYRRQNNGKALTNTQKRTAIESNDVSDVVFSLADHDFFLKVLSGMQLKRDVQRCFTGKIHMLTSKKLFELTIPHIDFIDKGKIKKYRFRGMTSL